MYYEPLPALLEKHYKYVSDTGHAINCIPKTLLPNAIKDNNYPDYMVALPVKYVLKKGYEEYDGCVVVDVPYGFPMGASYPSGFEEFQKVTAPKADTPATETETKGPETRGNYAYIDESLKIGDVVRTATLMPDLCSLLPSSTAVNFVMFMRKPTAKERRAIQQENVEILATQGDIPFVLVRCGTEAWKEAPYSPHHPIRETAVAETLRIIVFDTVTGRVVCLRTLPLPEKVYKILVENRDKYASQQFSLKKYNASVQAMQAEYTTNQLVELAREQENMVEQFDGYKESWDKWMDSLKDFDDKFFK